VFMPGMVWLFFGLSALVGAYWCHRLGYIKQEHRDLVLGVIWTIIGATVLYFFFVSPNPHKWGVPGCTVYERTTGQCG